MRLQGEWRRTSDPAVEPITASELRTQLRIETDDAAEGDAYLEALIASARGAAEALTRRALITQSWTLYLDDWPDSDIIYLPYPPCQSVTGITYYDADGVQQTLTSGTDYQTEIHSEPARVTPEPDASWPGLETDRLHPVEVLYVAGYGDAASAVPQEIRQAVLLIAAAWYRYREEVEDFGKTPLPAPIAARALLRLHAVAAY